MLCIVDLTLSVRAILLTFAVGSVSISGKMIFNSDGLLKTGGSIFIDKLLFFLPTYFNLGRSFGLTA
jgi:hypothetical protein